MKRIIALIIVFGSLGMEVTVAAATNQKGETAHPIFQKKFTFE